MESDESHGERIVQLLRDHARKTGRPLTTDAVMAHASLSLEEAWNLLTVLEEEGRVIGSQVRHHKPGRNPEPIKPDPKALWIPNFFGRKSTELRL